MRSNDLTARRSQAFAGAISLPFPVLGDDYVEYLLSRLAGEATVPQPSLGATSQAFATLGHRPEEMLRALRQLAHVPPGANIDEHLLVIAATLRESAADVELARVEQLGGLAGAIFGRIAAADGDTRGVFSTEAAAAYSKAIGREVRVDALQRVVNELLTANLVMRRGHGQYSVTDPFVQEIWRERQTYARQLDGGSAEEA